MRKHRIRSTAYDHLHPIAAAVEVAPGCYRFPQHSPARTLAGMAVDLNRAAKLRRIGHKETARDAIAFARDCRIFAPAYRLP